MPLSLPSLSRDIDFKQASRRCADARGHRAQRTRAAATSLNLWIWGITWRRHSAYLSFIASLPPTAMTTRGMPYRGFSIAYSRGNIGGRACTHDHLPLQYLVFGVFLSPPWRPPSSFALVAERASFRRALVGARAYSLCCGRDVSPPIWNFGCKGVMKGINLALGTRIFT